MPVEKIWVLVESFNGAPITPSLELLTAARGLGSTVEAVVWGADGEAVAGQLGAYGASKVYNVGDIGSALPGAPVGAAMAAAISGGNAPTAVLVPTTYDGRDVAGRLSVRLNKPVLTNVVGLVESGGSLVTEH